MNANNTVTLIGRMTKDPEVRYTNEQKAVCRFTLAVDRRNRQKETDFVSCVAFGSVAELLERYVGKGCRIVLKGSIRTGSYENREGQKVYTTDVAAEDLSIIDFKASAPRDVEFTTTDERTPFERTQEPYRGTQTSVPFVPDEDDGDLPF